MGHRTIGIAQNYQAPSASRAEKASLGEYQLYLCSCQKFESACSVPAPTIVRVERCTRIADLEDLTTYDFLSHNE